MCTDREMLVKRCSTWEMSKLIHLGRALDIQRGDQSSHAGCKLDLPKDRCPVIILSLLLVFCLLCYLYGLTCILFVSYTPSNQQKAHNGKCSHLEDTPTHNSGFCLHPFMDCHQDLLADSPVVFLCLQSCPAHKTTANTLSSNHSRHSSSLGT